VSKEPQAEGLYPIGDWQAPSGTPDCLVGSVPGVWNSQNFPQTPGVKGIETLLNSLCDGTCLASMEHDWENVGPVELHLRILVYILEDVLILH